MNRNRSLLGVMAAVLLTVGAFIWNAERRATNSALTNGEVAISKMPDSALASSQSDATPVSVESQGQADNRGQRVAVEQAATTPWLSILVRDWDERPLPDAVVVALDTDHHVLARYPANAKGIVTLDPTADLLNRVEEWVAGAPGFEMESGWMESRNGGQGTQTTLELQRQESALVRTVSKNGHPLEPGWMVNFDVGPFQSECFEWVPKEAAWQAATSDYLSLGALWKEAVGRDPHPRFRAPDGCTMAAYQVELDSEWLDEDSEGTVPPGTESGTFLYTAYAPLHPKHEPYWLLFRDAANEPIANADVVCSESGNEFAFRQTGSKGELLVDYFCDDFFSGTDMGTVVDLPDGTKWRLNIPTSELRERGSLVLSMALIGFDLELLGDRPELFEIAISSTHGEGYELGQPMSWWRGELHRFGEELSWMPGARDVHIEAPQGIGRFCCLVRHRSSGILSGGTCGIEVGVAHQIELPKLGVLQVELTHATESNWSLNLSPQKSAEQMNTSWGRITQLGPHELRCELPYGLYSASRRIDGLYLEMPDVEIAQSQVRLVLDTEATRRVRGQLSDSFGDPYKEVGLMATIEGFGGQHLKTDSKGSFELVVPAGMEAQRLAVQCKGTYRLRGRPTSIRWLGPDHIDVEFPVGRLATRIQIAPALAQSARFQLISKDSKWERKIALLEIQRGLLLSAGEYTLQVYGDRARADSLGMQRSFVILAGQETQVDLDCRELAEVQLQFRCGLPVEIAMQWGPGSTPTFDRAESLVGAQDLASAFRTWVDPHDPGSHSLFVMPGEIRIVLACELEAPFGEPLSFTLERTLHVKAGTIEPLEIDLNERVKAELRKGMLTRPELRVLLDELE